MRDHVSQKIKEILEIDFIEDEVESVMLHLSKDKSPHLDGLTNEFFKMYES